jgi:PBP1b-binding outer membrane lipoprotein LpoB
MKFIISLLLISIFLISCSTDSKVNAVENLSNQNVSIEAQINSLDAQLMHIDAMINAARMRKDMNQTDPTNINNSMIDNEVFGYESQKASIISQKNALQMQVKH